MEGTFARNPTGRWTSREGREVKNACRLLAITSMFGACDRAVTVHIGELAEIAVVPWLGLRRGASHRDTYDRPDSQETHIHVHDRNMIEPSDRLLSRSSTMPVEGIRDSLTDDSCRTGLGARNPRANTACLGHAKCGVK